MFFNYFGFANLLQVLEELLPEGVIIPTGFETVGHIAHLNLRDEHLPYKKLIAQVMCDTQFVGVQHKLQCVPLIQYLDLNFRLFWIKTSQKSKLLSIRWMLFKMTIELCNLKSQPVMTPFIRWSLRAASVFKLILVQCMFQFSPGSYFGFMDVIKIIPSSTTIGWHITIIPNANIELQYRQERDRRC